jgi:hypothetical protein
MLVWFGQMLACTTEDSDPEDRVRAAGGATTCTCEAVTACGGAADGTTDTDGAAGSSPVGTGGSPSAGGTACANPAVLDSAMPGIADFDAYDGASALNGDSAWSFALGGDSSVGVLAGTFVYGDEPSGLPETFEMVAGHDSTYALSISDTLADEYGGGMGLWITACLDATAFSGISFWVRGNAPTGNAKLTVLMEETTFDTPADPEGKVGTCSADTEEGCIHPGAEFEVTDSWTEIQIPWSEFAGGSADNTPVTVDGHNIWQIQFDIGLVWEADTETNEYVPTPAPYELVVDDLTFY